MAWNEKTSKELGRLASAVLRNQDSSAVAKRLAGCVLTQCADHGFIDVNPIHRIPAKKKSKKKPAAKK